MPEEICFVCQIASTSDRIQEIAMGSPFHMGIGKGDVCSEIVTPRDGVGGPGSQAWNGAFGGRPDKLQNRKIEHHSEF